MLLSLENSLFESFSSLIWFAFIWSKPSFVYSIIAWRPEYLSAEVSSIAEIGSLFWEAWRRAFEVSDTI